VRQILLNFVSNAVKFTPQGRIDIRISCETQTETEQVLKISVSDTGIGIPENRTHRLFKVFSQTDSSTSRKYGGSGLGLAISKKLAELMGGQVGFESREGRGSTFWCILPFEKTAETEDGICRDILPDFLPESEIWPESGHESGKTPLFSEFSPRILLAEDNIFNQKVTQIMLEKFGLSSDIANNGREVLEALGRKEYDLVLMDVQMPEMDGLEATEKIRKADSGVLNPHIPILAMTANAAKEDREKCLAAGMDDYLSKPVNADEMLHLIRKYIQPDITKNAGPAARRKPEETNADAPLSGKNAIAVFDSGDFLKRFDWDTDLCKRVLSGFPEQFGAEIEKLIQSLEEQNTEAIRHHAHTIKGMSANISAYRLRDIARQIGKAAKQEDAESALSLKNIFIQEAETLKREVSRFIQDTCILSEDAQGSPLSPSEKEKPHLSELISGLEKMLPKCKEILETFSINDMLVFAEKLQSLVTDCHENVICEYAEKVHQAAQHFDMDKTEKLLEKFPVIIDELKKG
jgi:CheY-like chemotaxis protein